MSGSWRAEEEIFAEEAAERLGLTIDCPPDEPVTGMRIMMAMEAEIAHLRLAIRRLADQDATLSVVGGNVIVEMDAITDKEYAAIEIAVAWVDKFDEPDVVAALEGLLRRAGGRAKADLASLRINSKEEEAIKVANAVLLGCSGDPERLAEHANVLRGLLERTK